MSPVQPATVDTTSPAPTSKLTWVDFARVYARRGWPVFPVHIAVRGGCSCGKPACTNKGKHPQTAHSFYDATTDEDVIRTWGEVDYPRANIGIRTGKDSGLVVLDIDLNKSGEESLRQLEAQYESLPETVTVVSGGGGRHLYFQHPGGLVPTTTGKLGSGLDTRGDGGYIIAPPSWHVSTQRYRWAPDKNPEQVQLAPFPAWLLDLLQKPQGQEGESLKERTSLAAQVIPEGQRNDELFRLGMTLWHKGGAEETVLRTLMSENALRCTPPLADKEVKEIVRSITRYPQGSGTPAKRAQQTEGCVQVLSARELMNKELPPVRWVVHNLIPEGLTLVAGGAKIGKSWAMLGMGIAVATGDRVFQYFDTEPGDVLYFALEDGQRRMQGRLDALSEGWEAPDSLRFSYECPMLPEFKETLEELMSSYPNTRLVVVDVLAKVQRRVRGIHNPYHADYDALAPLQRFALNQGIGVVMVTHTNQREMPTDELHSVTGTTGNIGCADTILLLKRGRSESSGVLYVTGRDVVEGVFKADFHNGVWVVQGEQAAPQPGPEPAARAEAQALLCSVLADGPRLATEVQEAAKAAGISEATLRRAKDDLKIKPKKQGVVWYWSLPAVAAHGEEENN